MVFHDDKSVSFPTWKWVTTLHGFNIHSTVFTTGKNYCTLKDAQNNKNKWKLK